MSQVEPLIYSEPEIYDAIYGEFDQDIEFYRSIASLATDDRICELGGGTGRVAIPLARSGRTVTSVDLSGAMAAAGKRKAEAAGVSVEWIQHDMATFSRPGQYGMVYVPLHSFSHLLEREQISQTLTAVHTNLVPGGALVLALHKPDAAYLGREEDGLYLVGEHTMPDGSPFTVYESTRYDIVDQRLYARWFLEFAKRTQSTRYELRMFFP